MLPRCALYRSDLEFGTHGQSRFVDRHLKRKRGRMKVNSQFLATLPEALCDEFDFEQLEEIDKVSARLDTAEVPQLHRPRFLNCISQAPSKEAEVFQLHQPDSPSHTVSKPPATMESLSPSTAAETIIRLPQTSKINLKSLSVRFRISSVPLSPLSQPKTSKNQPSSTMTFEK